MHRLRQVQAQAQIVAEAIADPPTSAPSGRESRFQTEHCAVLCSAVVALTNLTNLDLRCACLQAESPLSISRLALQRLLAPLPSPFPTHHPIPPHGSSLSHLFFSNNYLKPEGIVAICPAVAALPSLRTLTLGCGPSPRETETERKRETK